MRLKFSSGEMRAVSTNFAQQAQDLRTHARLLSGRAEQLTWQHGVESLIDESTAFRHAQRRALVSRVLEEADTLHRLGDEAEQLAWQLSTAADTGETQEHSVWQQMRRLAEHPGLVLSSPTFVSSVRALAAQIDLPVASLSGGLVGLISQLVRQRRGPDATASLGAFATGIGAKSNTSIAVSTSVTRRVTAPTTLAELARRVPKAESGEPQVRIERYQYRDGSSWIVYCSGTVTMKAHGDTEPWDMHSNLQAMAGQHSDSMDAVQQSMRQAGVRPEDQVLYVGFSQGGMLAAELASESKNANADLVTFGAPIAQIDLKRVDGAIAIEHAEDLVPALGGANQGDTSDRLVLGRRAFESIPVESGLPAHNLDRYASTAADAESAPDRELRAEKQKLLAAVTGEGQSTLWRAQRITSVAD